MARDTIMDIAGNPVHLAEYSTRSDNGLDVGIVDMGYHYPVSQPNLTISAEIEMDSILYPDEYYSIVTWLFNPDDIRLNVPVVFALEIHGVFYFWPDWKPVFDVARMTLHKGSNYVEILPSTKFPAEPYPYIEDCQAYCAFLTDDLSSIAGEMDVHQWTLGSAPPSASN